MTNDKYLYRVILDVEVEGFDEEDAFDRIQDVFGVGEDLGILVTECEYKPKHR